MTNTSTRHLPSPMDAYANAGVDTGRQEVALGGLLASIRSTLELRPGMGKPILPIGYFANVLNLGSIGLAVAIDGVGTKALVAQMLDKYDTIGIDCVAMNANDVLCVGAEPVAMLDYLAVQIPDETLMAELGRGLSEGARQANMSIPGGEVAQIAEMLKGYDEDKKGFDLVGCCLGVVELDSVLVGHDIEDGDTIIGLGSSGIHCNGVTLARDVLLESAGLGAGDFISEFGRTVGEELLEPTQIYVQAVLEMLKANLGIRALVHITSDGFLNLTRVDADVAFVIESLPEPQPIFEMIRRLGEIPPEEMFQIFNMGVGFCVVVDPDDAKEVQMIAERHDISAQPIGHAKQDKERTVHILPAGLLGREKTFIRA